MMNLPISMPLDEDGLFGRECPSCKLYFKLKLGTGLKTTQSICPYCAYIGEEREFYTQDQIAYIKSHIAKEFMGPMLRDFAASFAQTGTYSSDSLIQLKISVDFPEIEIRYYQEKVLETTVTCDNCGLVFSIYGVFSNCPDCGKLNARVIYEKSLDVSQGKLALTTYQDIKEQIRNEFIKDALTGTIAAFDALGKVLRTKHKQIPTKPPNLFQNFTALDKVLATLTKKDIRQFLTVADGDFLFLMFQVRHIYEHNAGVVDSEFVAKLPTYTRMLGRKYPLKKDDVHIFIGLMRELGNAIYDEFEK